MMTGWYDLFSGAGDMFLWYANLTEPKQLLVRPGDHSEVEKNQFDLNFEAEVHRWFDYWLKGIDNGIMKEPSIYYYVMGDSKKRAWRATVQWPLGDQKLTPFYFAEGKTGNIGSTKGNRIRITVAFSDADNFETPVIDPAPKLQLLRDGSHSSFIQLPIVQSR